MKTGTWAAGRQPSGGGEQDAAIDVCAAAATFGQLAAKYEGLYREGFALHRWLRRWARSPRWSLIGDELASFREEAGSLEKALVAGREAAEIRSRAWPLIELLIVGVRELLRAIVALLEVALERSGASKSPPSTEVPGRSDLRSLTERRVRVELARRRALSLERCCRRLGGPCVEIEAESAWRQRAEAYKDEAAELFSALFSVDLRTVLRMLGQRIDLAVIAARASALLAAVMEDRSEIARRFEVESPGYSGRPFLEALNRYFAELAEAVARLAITAKRSCDSMERRSKYALRAEQEDVRASIERWRAAEAAWERLSKSRGSKTTSGASQ